MKEGIKAIDGVTTYSGISSVGKRLAFWLQLADGFGWETMKGVFRDYEVDNIVDSSLLPSNTQEEKDQWLIRYSAATGHDLREFMVDTWGLQVSAEAWNATENLDLPTWMPAMGGLDELFVDYNQQVTFDLRAAALSMDGVATIDAGTMQVINGTLTENPDWTFTYSPAVNFSGTDSIVYEVVSSSGHIHTTTMDVIVAPSPE